MANGRLLSITLIALATLLVGVAGTIAQEPASEGATPAQASLGTTITFQGHLEDSGGPLDDTCDFEFELWDDAVGGGQVGATLPKNGVPVGDGKFTVQLDFGSSAFHSEERFLQIAVQCSDDPAFVDLTGRVALTAAPYALSFRAGAQVAGDLGNGFALALSNYSATGTGPGLYATTASTSSYASGVHGVVTHPFPGQFSAGVRGSNSGTQGSGAGVWGSHAAAGTGVRGTATSGIGVFGDATSSIAFNYGVFGQSLSANGTGIYGRHVNLSGTYPGVHGETYSTASSAAGVVGRVESTSPGSHSAGVRGINEGTGNWGIGVYGSQAGDGWGVYGTSLGGRGVFGHTTGGAGVDYGVYGQSESPDGVGVLGLHITTTGTYPGVWGETRSTAASAVGVKGRVQSTAPGSYSAGVRGINEGTGGMGVGVYGEHMGEGWGVYGVSATGYAGYFEDDIFVAGNCTGCALAYVGLNASNEPLEMGELVIVKGVDSPLAGTVTPVLRLGRADASSVETVVGVVQGRARLVANSVDGPQVESAIRAEGPAAPGDYLFIVVQGLVQVKVEVKSDTIQAGDDLMLADTLAGHAVQASDNREAQRIGRAMEDLDQGAGLIWVMVNLQ